MSSRPRTLTVVCWAIVALAVFEYVGHRRVVASVASDSSWKQATELVRSQFAQGDRIVAAPAWNDPFVRQQLGDLITIADAGASDLAGVKRLWELSIRGATSDWSPKSKPDFEQRFGGVLVRRWALSEPSVVYDFTERIYEARAEFVQGGVVRTCDLKTAPVKGGGLFGGAMAPKRRFVCDPGRTWGWVGPTVIEDLDLQPRRCVWQHPTGPEPVTSVFKDVPVGSALRLYMGLYYIHERPLDGVPFEVAVKIAEGPLLRFEHTDGEGWKRVDVDLTDVPQGASSVDVAVSTTVSNRHRRTVCWHAVMVDD